MVGCGGGPGTEAQVQTLCQGVTSVSLGQPSHGNKTQTLPRSQPSPPPYSCLYSHNMKCYGDFKIIIFFHKHSIHLTYLKLSILLVFYVLDILQYRMSVVAETKPSRGQAGYTSVLAELTCR